MESHRTSKECKESFLKMFEEATGKKRWMAAIWTVGEDGVVVQTTTNHWPNNLRPVCVESLKDLVEADTSAPPPGPLPEAPIVGLLRESVEETDEAPPKYEPEIVASEGATEVLEDV